MSTEDSISLNFSTLREHTLSVWYKTCQILKEKGWILTTFIVIAGILSTVTAIIEGPIYLSSARLMTSGQITLPEKEVFQEDRSGYLATQQNILQSDRILDRAKVLVASEHPEYKACPVDIKVGISFGTSIIKLDAVGNSPEYTRAYLQAVLQSYQEFKRQLREQATESTSSALQKELLKLETEIDNADKAKIDFQRTNNVTFMREQGKSVGDHLAKLKSEQAETATQYNLLANADIDSIPTGSDKIQGLEATEEYLKFKTELQSNELLMGQYEKVMRPAHPKLVALKDKVARQRVLLESYRAQSKSAIARARESVKIKLESLNMVVTQWEKKALDFSQKLAEFEQLDARLTRAQSMYEKLVTSVQTIDISQQLSNETLSVLEEPSTAIEVPLLFLKKIAIGLIIGGLLGGTVLFCFALLDNRFSSLEDLSNNLNFPVWGVIPVEPHPEKKRVGILVREDKRPVFSEAYRNLRSCLTHLNAKHPDQKVFVITSSIPSEGKTTVSANLAITMALTKKKVLLIDADLRRGCLHEDLGVENVNGFSDALEGKPFSIRTLPSGIDFISHGKTYDHPAELLEGSVLTDMVASWRQKYDWILFDTPPVLAAEDSAIIMPLADRMLYVVRANFTHADQVGAALRTLTNHSVKPSGLVFNLFDLAHPTYYNYKYSDYYHRSAKRDEGTPSSS